MQHSVYVYIGIHIYRIQREYSFKLPNCVLKMTDFHTLTKQNWNNRHFWVKIISLYNDITSSELGSSMMQTTQGRAGNIWNKKETHYLAPLKLPVCFQGSNCCYLMGSKTRKKLWILQYLKEAASFPGVHRLVVYPNSEGFFFPQKRAENYHLRFSSVKTDWKKPTGKTGWGNDRQTISSLKAFLLKKPDKLHWNDYN